MPVIGQSSFESLVTPNADEKITLYIIAAYAVVIGILWNVPLLRDLLFPFKIVTVAFHEFGHASAGLCTGAKIDSIELNPDEGGVTRMRGGNAWITLPAGYIGSSFWGALMVFAGFNVLASKIVSVIIGIALLATLWWAKNWLTRIITIGFIGVLVGLWFIANGIGLKYFVLFMGVMSCLYSLWDIIEDLVVRKVNESDASKFAKLSHCCPAQVWGVIWFLVSLGFLAVGIIAALIVFGQDGKSS